MLQLDSVTLSVGLHRLHSDLDSTMIIEFYMPLATLKSVKVSLTESINTEYVIPPISYCSHFSARKEYACRCIILRGSLTAEAIRSSSHMYLG